MLIIIMMKIIMIRGSVDESRCLAVDLASKTLAIKMQEKRAHSSVNLHANLLF